MLTDSSPKRSLLIETIVPFGKLLRAIWFFVKGIFVARKPGKKDLLHQKFYDHPLIKNYGESKVYSKPSYLPPRNFAGILIDVLKAELIVEPIIEGEIQKTAKCEVANLKELLVKAVANGGSVSQETAQIISKMLCDADAEARATMLANFAAQQAQAGTVPTGTMPYSDEQVAVKTMEEFSKKLEVWFNDQMNRVSGWYKRQAQWILFLLGLLMAIGFNIDTIDIANRLSKDKSARDKLVDLAMAYNKERPAENLKSTNADAQQKTYDSLVNYSRQLLTKDIDQANNIVSVGYNGWGISDPYFLHLLYRKSEFGFYGQSYNFFAAMPYPCYGDTLAQLKKAALDVVNTEIAQLEKANNLVDTLLPMLKLQREKSIDTFAQRLTDQCIQLSQEIELKTQLIAQAKITDTLEVHVEFLNLNHLVNEALNDKGKELLALRTGGTIAQSQRLLVDTVLLENLTAQWMANPDSQLLALRQETLAVKKNKRGKIIPSEITDSIVWWNTTVADTAASRLARLYSYNNEQLIVRRKMEQQQYRDLNFQLGVIRRFGLLKLREDGEPKTFLLKKARIGLVMLSDSLATTATNKKVYSNEISDKQAVAKLYENKRGSFRVIYVWYLLFTTHKFLGFLLTAFAISLGAPFWFDMLNKFVQLRGAVKEGKK